MSLVLSGIASHSTRVGGVPKFGKCEGKYFEISSGGKRGQHAELDWGGRSDWEPYSFFEGDRDL